MNAGTGADVTRMPHRPKVLTIKISESPADLADAATTAAGGGRYNVQLRAGTDDPPELRLDPTIELASETRDQTAARFRADGDLVQAGQVLADRFRDALVGSEWSTFCKANSAAGTLTYLDIEPAELQPFPWELILSDSDHRPNGGRPIRLFPADLKYRIVRGRPQDAARANTSIPLRVLVIVCDVASPAGAEAEIDAIYVGLRDQPGVWQIQVLRQPSWEELTAMSAKFSPLVLHFIGDTTENDPVAYRISSQNLTLSAEQIARLAKRRNGAASVLILNGHRTAYMAPASYFHDYGVQAILAMLTEIPSSANWRMMEALYTELAKTGSVIEAVGAARYELWNTPEDTYDWARPVLTVYGHDHDIIYPNLPDKAREEKALRSKRGPAWMADRVDKHWLIWGGQPDQLADQARKRLIVVSGTEGTGKTQLVRSCLLTWELCGVRGIVVDLKEPDPMDPRRVKASPQDTLRRICHELEVKFKDKLLGDLVYTDLVLFGKDLRQQMDDLEMYTDACRRMQDILRRIRSALPSSQHLILTLDHMEQIMEDPETLEPILKNNFLLPLAQGEVDGLYTILIYRKNPAINPLASSRNRELWEQNVSSVSVDLFPPGPAAVAVGREYLARRDGRAARSEWVERLSRDTRLNTVPWPPVVLKQIYDEYQQGSAEARQGS
jgi:hypothetical protein